MNFYKIATVVATICLIPILVGCRMNSSCQVQQPVPTPTRSTTIQREMGLYESAVKMFENYLTTKGKDSSQENEIPSSYWPATVRALNPVKVYVDRSNIVIVQKIISGVEFGKYITPGYSSYFPFKSEIVLMEETELDRMVYGVYDYRRKR